jgi:predicted amidohydrolase
MTDSQENAAVSPVRVAVVQFEPQVGIENLKKNALAVEQRLIAAADNGAGLVVLPELATTGYVFDTREEAFAHS